MDCLCNNEFIQTFNFFFNVQNTYEGFHLKWTPPQMIQKFRQLYDEPKLHIFSFKC